MKSLKAEFVDKIAPVVDEGTKRKVYITSDEAENRAQALALWNNLQKMGFIILSREKVEDKQRFAERTLTHLDKGRETHSKPVARARAQAVKDLLELILK